MVDVQFDIRVEEADARDERLLDEVEITAMLDHTRSQIGQMVQSRLGNLRCEEHNQPPRILVSGVYSLDTEQLELSYHIDTCCQPFLLRAVAALNH